MEERPKAALQIHLPICSQTCWYVGMADETDSKSVVGDHVWVQVPLPALKKFHKLVPYKRTVVHPFTENLQLFKRKGV